MKDDTLDPEAMAADPSACTAIFPFAGAQVCGHHRPDQPDDMAMTLSFASGGGRASTNAFLTTAEAVKLGHALIAMAQATEDTQDIVNTREAGRES